MKNKKVMILFLIGFLVGISGLAITFFMYNKKEFKREVEEKKEFYVTSTSDIIFTNVSDSINLGDVIPTLDKFGVNNKSFSFSIKNISNTLKDYTLTMVDNNSTILNKMVRYEITKNNEVIGIYTLNDNGIIDIGKINSNEEISYSLKLWLDYNSDVKIGSLNKKISVSDNIDYLDNTNINKPILIDGMIPVYYDYDKASFCKADINNSYYYEWYNYDKKLYANSVTVNKDKREEYQKSPLGTPISMNDINSMWVWIPKFTYTLNENTYNIQFVDKSITTYGFNNNESGFWVSKFEAGLSNDDECIIESLTNKCNKNNKKIIFKPNISLVNRITMANLFYSIRSMELKENIYGFKGNGIKVNNDGTIKNDNNNFDIHMIKNSEWDVISILSLSKYGNSNLSFNNTNYTGMSSVNNVNYNFNIKDDGELGSTTNNVSGVYDMSGGKCEYTMINNSEKSIFTKKSNSGFIREVKSNYYDVKNDDNKLNYTIKSDIVSRGGYKNINSGILNVCSINDYVNKISLMTNSRAVITIMEE